MNKPEKTGKFIELTKDWFGRRRDEAYTFYDPDARLTSWDKDRETLSSFMLGEDPRTKDAAKLVGTMMRKLGVPKDLSCVPRQTFQFNQVQIPLALLKDETGQYVPDNKRADVFFGATLQNLALASLQTRNEYARYQQARQTNNKATKLQDYFFTLLDLELVASRMAEKTPGYMKFVQKMKDETFAEQFEALPDEAPAHLRLLNLVTRLIRYPKYVTPEELDEFKIPVAGIGKVIQNVGGLPKTVEECNQVAKKFAKIITDYVNTLPPPEAPPNMPPPPDQNQEKPENNGDAFTPPTPGGQPDNEPQDDEDQDSNNSEESTPDKKGNNDDSSSKPDSSDNTKSDDNDPQSEDADSNGSEQNGGDNLESDEDSVDMGNEKTGKDETDENQESDSDEPETDPEDSPDSGDDDDEGDPDEDDDGGDEDPSDEDKNQKDDNASSDAGDTDEYANNNDDSANNGPEAGEDDDQSQSQPNVGEDQAPAMDQPTPEEQRQDELEASAEQLLAQLQPREAESDGSDEQDLAQVFRDFVKDLAKPEKPRDESVSISDASKLYWYEMDNYKIGYDQVLRKMNFAKAQVLRNLFKRKAKDFQFVVKGMKSGRLDTNKLAEAIQNVPTVYQRLGQVKTNKICVGVLIDESGSMQGLKREKAQEAAIFINEVFGKVPDVELFIYGHTSNDRHKGRRDTEMSIYREPGKTSKPYALGKLYHGTNNRDGYAILASAARIRKFTQNPGILLVISDGLPSAYSPYEDGIADTREKVKKVEKMGFNVVQVAIDSVQSHLMFTHYVEMTNLQTFPDDLIRYMAKNVDKMIRATVTL